jgi:hypothetical protein
VRRALLAFSMLAAACNSKLPDLPPTAFACVDDSLDENGDLQCPESHFCSSERCLPRLGCREEGRSEPGCDEERRRCDLVINDEIAAVTCQGGIHTETSTPARSGDRCDCPDGLHCVALAESSADPEALPLFLLTTERVPAELPIGLAEIPWGRMCVRVCSSEYDCPSNHACRAAAVLGPESVPLGPRRTIGVCYPHVLPTTSTVSDQPDPEACFFEGDCTRAAGRDEGLCQAQVVIVPDHPSTPAGAEAWHDQRALVPRCVPDVQSNLLPDGRGCTDSKDCQSGICLSGGSARCAKLCDPMKPEVCSFGGRCAATVVSRSLPQGGQVVDKLFVCVD